MLRFILLFINEGLTGSHPILGQADPPNKGISGFFGRKEKACGEAGRRAGTWVTQAAGCALPHLQPSGCEPARRCPLPPGWLLLSLRQQAPSGSFHLVAVLPSGGLGTWGPGDRMPSLARVGTAGEPLPAEAQVPTWPGGRPGPGSALGVLREGWPSALYAQPLRHGVRGCFCRMAAQGVGEPEGQDARAGRTSREHEGAARWVVRLGRGAAGFILWQKAPPRKGEMAPRAPPLPWKTPREEGPRDWGAGPDPRPTGL